MSDNSDNLELNPLYAQRDELRSVPRGKLGQKPMLAESAYQIIHDEVMLDGNSRLNLATFVGTWMDDYARRLYSESFDKNIIDKDEYPQTARIEEYCLQMLADLWHAPDAKKPTGTSTTGSSEACMLAGLAFKRKWQNARRASGQDVSKPNLVMSSAVQVCWEKFCNYFDVEPRYVPISDEHSVFDGVDLEKYVDENTIGVVAIMGVTYTGRYEPVEQIAAALDQIQNDKGLNIPIHVDGASGAMVAPFLQPDLNWDFRLSRVKSINTSGHKYGLVYPGIGWVLWRNASDLPEDLVFKVDYLGGEMPTFSLNFSRPGAQVLLQYYLFLRLGFEGYKEVQQASQTVAKKLAKALTEFSQFKVISDGSDIPVVAWTKTDQNNWSLYDLSEELRINGWQVPAYQLPANLTETTVQRIVVRNGLSMEMTDDLIDDIREAVKKLDQLDCPLPAEPKKKSFKH
ncbi:glutamate decarboxylase [Candidatus Saccharibacteria bacterium]|nr:glutamate decarboxylase [Candidatus Saccharibacteria bacterium]